LERVVEVVDKNFKYLSYRQRAGGMAITKCQTAAAGVVRIPELIDGLPVVEISANAFDGCTGITEVVLPGSVTKLGNGAFANASKLLSVNLPEGITALPDYLFSQSVKLDEINLPSTLKTIGQSSFNQCISLSGITIPVGVSSIGHDAFSNAGLQSVIIPEGLSYLGDRAFYNNTQLESVSLPGSLDQVSWECFGNSFNLKQVTLAEGTTRLRGYSFRDTGIEEIVIPSSVNTLEEWAFSNCVQLTSIVMQGNAPSLSVDNTFSNVSGSARVYVKGGSQGYGTSFGGLNVILDPRIELLGEPLVIHRAGTSYSDAGAVVHSLSGDVVEATVVGTVDIQTLGDFTLTYSAVDSQGNQAKPVSRVVRVVDALLPIISLEGAPYVIHEQGTQYADAGATASDRQGNPVTVNVTGSVDVFNAGNY
jgi:hypothetical protein